MSRIWTRLKVLCVFYAMALALHTGWKIDWKAIKKLRMIIVKSSISWNKQIHNDVLHSQWVKHKNPFLRLKWKSLILNRIDTMMKLMDFWIWTFNQNSTRKTFIGNLSYWATKKKPVEMTLCAKKSWTQHFRIYFVWCWKVKRPEHVYLNVNLYENRAFNALIHNCYGSYFMQFNQVTLRKQLAINPFGHDKANGLKLRDTAVRANKFVTYK